MFYFFNDWEEYICLRSGRFYQLCLWILCEETLFYVALSQYLSRRVLGEEQLVLVVPLLYSRRDHSVDTNEGSCLERRFLYIK